MIGDLPFMAGMRHPNDEPELIGDWVRLTCPSAFRDCLDVRRGAMQMGEVVMLPPPLYAQTAE
jgi:hypothetical protein